MTSRNRVRQALAVASGVCVGIAAGFLITDGDPLLLAAAVACVVGAVALSAWVVPRSVWGEVLPLVLFATALRVAVAVVVFDALVAVGRGGFVTGDDAGYADLSSRLARILHGESAPFDYGGESYLLGTFVYLETATFYVFGPKVLIVEMMNAAMGGMLVAFVYDIARRVFGDRRIGLVAAALVSIYPSLVLWSALNLKDSLALLLIALVIWLILVSHTRQSWLLLPAAFAPLLLMESLRNYIFFGLAMVIPASVALVPGNLRDRTVKTAVAVGLSVLLLAIHFADVPSPLASGLAGFEEQRAAMGVGARTSFADAPVVEVQSATTYVITTSSASRSTPASASPTQSPNVVVVAPGTRLAVVTDPSIPSPLPGVVVVRPGDVVVVGRPDATPATAEERKPLEIAASASTVQLVSESDSDPLTRTLRYLPRGVAFVLFAPFPWLVTRPLDLLPVPEMLLWYLALAGAVFSVIRYRRAWRLLAPLLLFVGGTFFILAMAEGNVGTLYRHRAMLIPFVLILASPGFAVVLHRRAERGSIADYGQTSPGRQTLVGGRS